MENKIQDEEEQIRNVESEILAVTAEQARAPDKDVNYWRKKDELLRKKEEQLREEELIALRAGATATATATKAAGPGLARAAADIGDPVMDAMAAEIAKAVMKELKPMLKPIFQHVYGPQSRTFAFEESDYRPAALQHYTGELQPRYATCAVSGVQLPVQDVVAGHIYQPHWPFTKDVKMNDPSNILLMHRKVEQQFANLAFTITPVELKVVLLHKKRTDKVLFEFIDDGGYQKSVKLGDLDGRLLAVAEGTAPSEYALNVHATSAFNYALLQQRCSAADIPPTVHCDRELFHRFLRDSANCSSSGGDSGGGSGSSQDINITGEAGATATVEGSLSSSGGSCGSAGSSDKVESDLAVAAQQQLQL